jgi:hypothetical protein
LRRYSPSRDAAPGAEAGGAAERGAGEATRETAVKIAQKERPLDLFRGGASSLSCCPPMAESRTIGEKRL